MLSAYYYLRKSTEFSAIVEYFIVQYVIYNFMYDNVIVMKFSYKYYVY